MTKSTFVAEVTFDKKHSIINTVNLNILIRVSASTNCFHNQAQITPPRFSTPFSGMDMLIQYLSLLFVTENPPKKQTLSRVAVNSSQKAIKLSFLINFPFVTFFLYFNFYLKCNITMK